MSSHSALLQTLAEVDENGISFPSAAALRQELRSLDAWVAKAKAALPKQQRSSKKAKAKGRSKGKGYKEVKKRRSMTELRQLCDESLEMILDVPAEMKDLL